MDSAYIFVRYFARETQLSFEIFLNVRIGSNLRLKNFQGHDFAGFEVANFINDAGSASPDLRQDIVSRWNVGRRCQPVLDVAIGFDVRPDNLEDVFLFRAPVDGELAQPSAVKVGFGRDR